MKPTLSSLKISVIFLFVAFITTTTAQAQVTLRRGSIVPVGWNALSTTNSIRLAVLQEIPVGSIIYFSDWGWDNGSDGFIPASVSNIGEGQVIWTAGSTVPAGTVLLLRLIGSTGSPAVSLQNLTTGASLNSNITFSSFTSADPMLTTGDGLFVFQKNSVGGTIFFISGFNNSAGGTSVVDASGWNTVINLAAIDSYLPDGGGALNALINGVNAIGMTTASGLRNLDNVQYVGPTTDADTATWRTRLMTIANWSGDNTGTVSSTVGTSLNLLTLPVSLVYFNAAAENERVLLSWKTASENNTRQFVIERSSDGSLYKDIDNVPATRGANGGIYNYVDKQSALVSGMLFYRLRIEDADSRKEYSPVARVKGKDNNQLAVAVFPNPLMADHKAQINITLPSDGLYSLQLTDLAGKVIRTESRRGLKGTNAVEWSDLKALAGGTYLLKLLFNDHQKVLKIVK